MKSCLSACLLWGSPYRALHPKNVHSCSTWTLSYKGPSWICSKLLKIDVTTQGPSARHVQICSVCSTYILWQAVVGTPLKCLLVLLGVCVDRISERITCRNCPHPVMNFPMHRMNTTDKYVWYIYCLGMKDMMQRLMQPLALRGLFI